MSVLQVFESTVDASMSPNADDMSLAIDGKAEAGLVCGWRRGCSTLLSGDPRRWNTNGCCADGAGDVQHCCQEIPADGTQRVLRRFKKIREANIGRSPPVFAYQKPAGKADPRKICLLLDLKYDQVMK